MSDLSPFLVTAVLGLASTVSGMGLYIWRSQNKSRSECERERDICLEELANYEKPAKLATRELLANARLMRRGSPGETGDPWPWLDSASRQRPRTPRRRS